jgi:hypothetical protein
MFITTERTIQTDRSFGVVELSTDARNRKLCNRLWPGVIAMNARAWVRFGRLMLWRWFGAAAVDSDGDDGEVIAVSREGAEMRSGEFPSA